MEEDETHEINFLCKLTHTRHTQVNVNCEYMYACMSVCPFYCHLMSYISKRCPSTLYEHRAMAQEKKIANKSVDL